MTPGSRPAGAPTTGAGTFGVLLRGYRDRTVPEALGLVAGGRRTAGVRREELAALAGLSVDYVVRLEQGRARKPSDQVVVALARALRLAGEDEVLLHAAAGLAAPVDAVSHTVPASVARVARRLGDLPVAVYSADWWLLTWNGLWAALQGDPAGLSGRDRNLVWHQFTGGASRIVKSPEEQDRFLDAIVADLRVASVEHPTDVSLAGLVADLQQRSTDFATRWREGRVGRHRSERKRIDHPRVGSITLDCDVLQAPGSNVHLIAYSAEPGTEDASRLDLLRVLGAEAFAR